MQAPKALKDAQDIANTLDTAVKIPFLGLRVGLDFLIGLIPGVGDAIVLLLSWRIVYLGKKLGAPKHVIGQMIRHSLVDFGLGCIPLVGDIVDIFYKANQKNVRLLETWWITENKEAVDSYAKAQLAQWEAEQDKLNEIQKNPTQQALESALAEEKRVSTPDFRRS
ncbi:DUF4112 domain-containing protein [Opacimonas viscosa]|uniref:DUF4112 domain-containing protein n=1 Tax=Opacimonas viscosa TaxID=2961944 RepID=UPI0032C3DBC4